jgi:enamine deaminase RidA (YjgF/YER057c/UK114 family)
VRRFYSLAALVLFQAQAVIDIGAVIPRSRAKPVSLSTPGIRAGDYLYVAGQGARAPDGSLPSRFEDQVRQALENVQAVVESDGLTMENVVYTHVYLEDLGELEAMDRVYAQYFPGVPPARATLGVARLDGTPIEVSAVAVRDRAHKRAVSPPGRPTSELASPGILTHDRLFISGTGASKKNDPEAEVDGALDAMASVLDAAGLSMRHLVFVNPYLTAGMPLEVMNERYARRFEFGNTPARATIRVAGLPEGASIELTGVAVRDLAKRRAVRPKNMAESPTASPCVFAGDTLYCSAKSGFIPGPQSGIYAATVEHQLRQTMRNLLDGLEEADLDFGRVVATNVYLDDLRELEALDAIYTRYLKEPLPARTTIQQVEPAERKPDGEGRYPTLEQISLIAVK